MFIFRATVAAFAFAMAIPSATAQHILPLRVVDADDRTPLPGVNVVVERTLIGGATDAGPSTLSLTKQR